MPCLGSEGRAERGGLRAPTIGDMLKLNTGAPRVSSGSP